MISIRNCKLNIAPRTYKKPSNFLFKTGSPNIVSNGSFALNGGASPI